MHHTHHEHGAELVGVGELLGSSWQGAKERYGQMLLLGLASTAVSLLAVVLGYGLYLATASLVAVWVYGVIAFIIVAAVGVYAQVANISVALHPPHTMHPKQLIAAGNNHASSFFLTSLLYGLGSFIGFLLFVVPGAWFAYRYSMAFVIVVAEKTTVREAFKRSAAYTKGHFWPLVFRALAFLFIYFLIAGVVNGAGFFLFRALGFADAEHVNLSPFVNVFLAPWYTMYAVSVYHSLVLLQSHPHES